MRATFLGTGASGGTPGDGRTRRHESSLLIETGDAPGTRALVDATRDLERQLDATAVDARDVDALFLTHGHRDASGGVPALRRRRRDDDPPVPTFASERTLAVLAERYARRDHLDPRPTAPGDTVQVGALRARPVEVPHATDRRFDTFAWRFSDEDGALVYASDLARLTDDLERLVAGTDLLVLDGAMYRRSLVSHLRIDRDLPTACRWSVSRILLTQIGRTAPPHEELVRVVADLCERAGPAYDGLQIDVREAA